MHPKACLLPGFFFVECDADNVELPSTGLGGGFDDDATAAEKVDESVVRWDDNR